MEAQVLQQAREVFQTGQAVVRDFNLTGADAASMDMICGGRFQVFICLLSARLSVNMEIYRAIGSLLHTRQRALLVTRLTDQTVGNDCFRGNTC